MDTKEKRLLFEYCKLHQPIWQMDELNQSVNKRKGLFKFWLWDNWNWKDDYEQGLQVVSFDGYDWEYDSFADWDFIQKIVDKHHAGKLLTDLGKGANRIVPQIYWEHN